MGRIPHPIHKAQSPVVEARFRKVVLDENEFAADPAGILQNGDRRRRMMKDINEEAEVEGVVGKRQMLAVKELKRNSAVRAGMDFDSFHVQTGDQAAEKRSQRAVATAHIQKAASGRKKGGELPRQNVSAPVKDQARVNSANQVREKTAGFAVDRSHLSKHPGGCRG